MNKIKVIICDIDNVILDSRELDKYIPEDRYDREKWDIYNSKLFLAKPNKIMVDYVKFLSKEYPIIFITAREMCIEKFNTLNITIEQLYSAFNSKISFENPNGLFMRQYNNFEDSDIVKEKILNNRVLPYYDVKLAIDDCPKNISMYQKYNIDTMLYTIF